MDRASLRKLARRGTHEVAPKDHRNTPIITGDYRLDASIAGNGNSDMATRLANALAGAPVRVRRGIP